MKAIRSQFICSGRLVGPVIGYGLFPGTMLKVNQI